MSNDANLVSHDHDGFRIHEDHGIDRELRWIVQAYGFLIPVNTSVSFGEFAGLITETYSLSQPTNAYAVAHLRKLEALENAAQSPLHAKDAGMGIRAGV